MSKCTLCIGNCNKTTKRFKECALRVRKNYNHFCEEYIRLFCEKHEFDYEETRGTPRDHDIVFIGDLFFTLTDIRIDIDKDAPKRELMDWYEYALKAGGLGANYINYESWLKGCPRMSEEDFEKLSALQKNVRDVEQLLIDEIERLRQQTTWI